MIIIVLGTNIGNRLQQLRTTLSLLQKNPNISVTHVSPLYESSALLPDNAPETWNQDFLNCAVSIDTDLEPLALLDQLKTIERELGRNNKQHWAPRPMDIDILSWHNNEVVNLESLTIPHKELHKRPFALWPLLDLVPDWLFPDDRSARQISEAWGSRFTGQAPLNTRQIQHRIDTPQLMGCINTTPDSFSDGGLFTASEQVIQRSIDLYQDGATIIDIGAESTCPTATAVNPEQEWLRLAEPLTALLNYWQQQPSRPLISVDTRHYQVAKHALELGIDWLNDVSGLDDERMRELVIARRLPVVIMHHLKLPEDRNFVLDDEKGICRQILAWAEQRIIELEQSGLRRDQLIFDPGIGFGKKPEQSLAVLQQINQFKQLGLPLLVGHSRKTVFNVLTDKDFSERDLETATTSVYLAEQGVDYLRLHNVAATSQALKVACSLMRPFPKHQD